MKNKKNFFLGQPTTAKKFNACTPPPVNNLTFQFKNVWFKSSKV